MIWFDLHKVTFRVKDLEEVTQACIQDAGMGSCVLFCEEYCLSAESSDTLDNKENMTCTFTNFKHFITLLSGSNTFEMIRI